MNLGEGPVKDEKHNFFKIIIWLKRDLTNEMTKSAKNKQFKRL